MTVSTTQAFVPAAAMAPHFKVLDALEETPEFKSFLSKLLTTVGTALHQQGLPVLTQNVLSSIEAQCSNLCPEQCDEETAAALVEIRGHQQAWYGRMTCFLRLGLQHAQAMEAASRNLHTSLESMQQLRSQFQRMHKMGVPCLDAFDEGLRNLRKAQSTIDAALTDSCRR